MESNIAKQDNYWVSPQCTKDDGTLMKFVNRDYLIRYLRYLREKKANAQL